MFAYAEFVCTHHSGCCDGSILHRVLRVSSCGHAGLFRRDEGSCTSHARGIAAVHYHASYGVPGVQAGRPAHSLCHWVSVLIIIMMIIIIIIITIVIYMTPQ